MPLKRLFASLLLLFAMPFAVAVAAVAPHRVAHAATDWTKVTAATPDGGIRIGNPAAKVRLVEYGSFTCPHCAAFAKEAWPAIQASYVRSGKLSFEFRPALRDGADMTAALTAYCGGPPHFFGTASALFGAQDAWLNATADWAQQHQDQDLSAEATMASLAQAAGLTAIAAKNGVPAERLDQCLVDPAARERLAKVAGDAWDVRKIGGTPGFYLNDDKLDGVYGWAALEPRLKAAVAG